MALKPQRNKMWLVLKAIHFPTHLALTTHKLLPNALEEKENFTPSLSCMQLIRPPYKFHLQNQNEKNKKKRETSSLTISQINLFETYVMTFLTHFTLMIRIFKQSIS